MNYQTFHSLLTTHPAFMLYFYNDTCGVCKVLWPRVEALVKEKFPQIELIRVQAEESRELAGQLRMLSVPGMLLFLDGREYFRANGMISMEELEGKIGRPYG
ncbi:MAG: thioredoxin, partial [Bacteroidetes bacterium]